MSRCYRDDVRFQFADCCSCIREQLKQSSEGKLFDQPRESTCDSPPQATTFCPLPVYSRDAVARAVTQCLIFRLWWSWRHVRQGP